jgi:hypothetical protein
MTEETVAQDAEAKIHKYLFLNNFSLLLAALPSRRGTHACPMARLSVWRNLY